MKIVIGLGNPGDTYSSTRHNIGFRTVEKLAAALASDELWQEKRSDPPYAVYPLGKNPAGEFWMLFKPLTYMNESGKAVAAYLRNANVGPGDLWVVHDDVDLPEGELRQAWGSGSAGHKGVESIINALGTQDFHRLRVGIGRPIHPDQSVEDFVLEPTSEELLETLAGKAAGTLLYKIQHRE